LHQCLPDRGQLTTIAATSSNQTYAVQKAASETVSLRRTPMDQQIFLRRGTDVGARQVDVHLQRATADGETDIARLNRGMSIRRSKKRTNMINEARIKACISRFDTGAYTRVQFLRAVSHSVGVYAVPEDGTADSDAVDDDEVRNDSDSDQPQSAVSEPQSQDLCEVCLVQQRDTRLAFVSCEHQRVCASCVAQLEQQARGCPIQH